MCGGPRGECLHEAKQWHPRLALCHKAAALAAFQRLLKEAHKSAPFHDGTRKRWAAKFSRDTPFHFLDGATVWVAAEQSTDTTFWDEVT